MVLALVSDIEHHLLRRAYSDRLRVAGRALSPLTRSRQRPRGDGLHGAVVFLVSRFFVASSEREVEEMLDMPVGWYSGRKTLAELIDTEALALWLACYTLLVESKTMKRGGVPRRQIPKKVEPLVVYATELLAYCKKKKILGAEKAQSAAENVERHLGVIAHLRSLSRRDDPR